MRGILVDWLVDVHKKFGLKDETLFFTVNLLDRFLAKRKTQRRELQLVGVATMLIASKFEDTRPPTVNDFANITANVDWSELVLHPATNPGKRATDSLIDGLGTLFYFLLDVPPTLRSNRSVHESDNFSRPVLHRGKSC